MRAEVETAYAKLYFTHHARDHHDALVEVRDLYERYKTTCFLVSPWTKNLETHKEFGFGEYP